MWLDHLWRDATYAARGLRRTPSFTAIAILTLALGIGANSAMFSIVYGVLLRPLPYRDADRIVLVEREQDLAGAHRPVPSLFGPTEFGGWQQRLQTFDAMAMYSTDVAAFTTDHGADVLDTSIVSSGFFPALGGPMAAGRPLGADDDLAPSAVISERLSARLFASPQQAIGRQVVLSFRSFTIVGVADSAFQVPSAKTEAWLPAGFMRTVNPRCCRFHLIGRLKPDVTIARAAAEAAATTKALDTAAPGGRASELRTKVIGFRDQLVSTVRPALLVLFTAVGLMLLVACVNVVNLLLARQVSRGREAAIRSALGASRSRLVAHTLMEVVLLTAGGAALGIVLAAAGIRALTWWPPPHMPRLDAVHLDVPVILFSIGVAGLAALLAGLLPAWQPAHAANALRWGAAGAVGTPSGRMIRRALCAAELAVSLVLLVGAMLLGRSLAALLHTDLGVNTDHVVSASMNLAFGARPTDAQTVARVDRVLDRIRTLPGVRSAGAGTALPPNAARLRLTMRREGETVEYQASGVAVTPEFFTALGMRLIAGRFFNAADDLNHAPVMIMSADTARRFFGDGDPIGRTMLLPFLRDGKTGQETMTLVGIVANVRYSGLDMAADDAVYRPFPQQTLVAPFLVVRTTGDPGALAPTIAREVAALDPGIVMADVRPLDAVISDAVAQPRFRTVLLGSIAGLALAMAVVGLYGVVAYSVAQRTKEIGIRMALGARRADVLAMVVRENVQVAVAGIAIGIVAAAGAARALTGLLYGIAPTDAVSFGAASVSLLIVALLAAYVPARRATTVDPLIALRDE